MADKPYDLAIIGAGMAGCVLAGKIAENGINPATGEPLKIVLMDRGPYFPGKPNPGYGIPLRRQMFTNIRAEVGRRYRFSSRKPPNAASKIPLQPGEEIYRQGVPAIFGGATLHYTARTAIPDEVDYEVWVNETGADWSYRNFKPFADEITRAMNIHAKPDALLCRLDHLVRDAAQSIGYPVVPITIAKKNCLLTGYCDGVNSCKYDARMGSFISHLPIAVEHGVQMMPDCNVERILLEKRGAQVRVRGLEYVHEGTRKTMEVERVIVSCGDYANPPLLYRSGYGPRELVEGNLVVENRNVGRHTDAAPRCRAPVGVFDEPLSDGEFRHRGAYFIYHDTMANKHYDRVQISVSPGEVPLPYQAAINAVAPAFGREHKEWMRDLGNPMEMTQSRRHFAVQYKTRLTLKRPSRIRGYISEWGEQVYRGNDPSIIKPLAEGREVLYELLKKMGAKTIVGMDKPIEVYYIGTYVGSCQPGVDPKTSVVNPDFESHDVDGLFICDGSTVPRTASQGYAGTVATLAQYAASRIVQQHFKRG